MASYFAYVLYALLQSLEDEVVSETVLKLVSLQIWKSLSFGRLQVSLDDYPAVILHQFALALEKQVWFLI